MIKIIKNTDPWNRKLINFSETVKKYLKILIWEMIDIWKNNISGSPVLFTPRASAVHPINDHGSPY